MKLQFDAKQEFQIDAVNAAVDLFDGQPLNKGESYVWMLALRPGFFQLCPAKGFLPESGSPATGGSMHRKRNEGSWNCFGNSIEVLKADSSPRRLPNELSG